MKILVTGSSGLLGIKLTDLILAEGVHEVCGISRSDPDADYPFHKGDITDKAFLAEVFQKEKPDVVVNTAAMTNVDQCELEQQSCWAVNVNAVNHLIAECQKQSAFLLHVSTDFIFDGTHGPLKEDEQPSPVNFYGESKLEAERLVVSSGLDWAIARTVLVYGYNPTMTRSNIVLWVRDSLMQGKEINVVDDQFRTPTLAEDLATGCYLIAQQKAKGIFHISGRELMTPYDIAVKTAEVFELDASLIKRTDSTRFTQPAARPLRTGFITTKAESELGYDPHSFTEGLKIIRSQLS